MEEDNKPVETTTFWYVEWRGRGKPVFRSTECRYSYGIQGERVFETVGHDPHFGQGYFLSEAGNNGVGPDKSKVLAYWRKSKASENNQFLQGLQRNIEGIKALEAAL